MSLRWYAIVSKIKTRDKFLKEIKKSPAKSWLREIKDVIAYDFERDTVGLSPEDGLLSGYALIQFEHKMLKNVVQAMNASKVGHFIVHGENGLPYPVPKEEVIDFQSGVKEKREEFHVGDKVRITDGILKGFDGEVVKKNKLMVGVKVLLPNSTIIRPVNIMSLEKRK
jgi:transcription antitermination factor NusG